MNQQQIDALLVDQLWNSVCLATKECHRCGGTGADNPVQPYGQEPNTCMCAIDPNGPQPGRVWALPGMQERCLGALMATKESDADYCCDFCGWEGGQGAAHYIHDHDCERCHGTGWVLAEIHAETLQNALQELLASEMGDTLQISFSYYNHADPFVECKIEKGRSWLADARGDTALRAMVAAAVKAVQAGQEAIREA